MSVNHLAEISLKLLAFSSEKSVARAASLPGVELCSGHKIPFLGCKYDVHVTALHHTCTLGSLSAVSTPISASNILINFVVFRIDFDDILSDFH